MGVIVLAEVLPDDRALSSLIKVATTLVDLLIIELMLVLSRVKQMYSQLVDLTHELM